MKRILLIITLLVIGAAAGISGFSSYQNATAERERNDIVNIEKERLWRIQAHFHVLLLAEATASCEAAIGQPVKGLLVLGTNNTQGALTTDVLKYRIEKGDDPQAIIAEIREAIHELLYAEELAKSVEGCAKHKRVTVALEKRATIEGRTIFSTKVQPRIEEFFRTANNEMAKATALTFNDIGEPRLTQIRDVLEQSRSH